jgi:hypothetical protein
MDGEPTRADFIVLFDPETKLYLWEEETMRPGTSFAEHIFNSMHSGDLSFTLLSCSDGLSAWRVGNDIAVQMSITKATDMDKAFVSLLPNFARHGMSTKQSRSSVTLST